MKKILTLILSFSTMICFAQNIYTPVVKSTAFSQSLSKNKSLVFSKSMAAQDAFLFLCEKDSTHLFFPDYRSHIQNLPNAENATHLEVWDIQYIREAITISDTSQFILSNSELLTPGMHEFHIGNEIHSNYYSNTQIQSISFDDGLTWNALSNNSISTIIPSNSTWFSVAVNTKCYFNIF